MSAPIPKEFGIVVRYDSFRNRVLVKLDDHEFWLVPEDSSILSDLLREAVAKLALANARKQ